MPRTVTTITGPAHLASALINGDISGLDHVTGMDELDHFLKYAEGYDIVDVARDPETGEALDPRFTWSFELHGGLNARGGEVIDYVAFVEE